MRAILLVDHGSRVAAANQVLEDVVAAMRVTLGGGALVAFAHQEVAPPSVGEAVDALVAQGAAEIVVVPFFLAPGRHATEDVPRLAREAAARHLGLRVEVVAPPLPASAGALAAIVAAAVEGARNGAG
jgi:sirohydrochlorin ferrochelatase